LKFIPLASSSAGNAYIVDDGETRLLLECGVGPRRLQALLRGRGYALSGLSACLVTHEHKDHSRSIRRVLDSGVPVWCSAGTARALELVTEEGYTDCNICQAGEVFSVGTVEALPFAVFHDAAEPLGYLLRSRRDGDKLAFATDTVNLRYRFPDVNLLAVECNYQEEILARNTRIPAAVVHRIRNSHMELGRLCGYLSGLDLSQCREIYLLHLSDASSDEAWFAECVRRAINCGAKVMVCPKGG